MLGLSLYLEGRFAEAIPWLERTRAAVPDNLELNFTLGQAYIQTRERREGARARWRTTFGVRRRFRGGARRDRAADDPAADGGDGGSGAAARRSSAIRARRAPTSCSARSRSFAASSTRRSTRSTRELALNPSDAMALYQLGDALRAPESLGRGDSRAAAVALAEPVLQRAVHPARPRLHEEGAAGHRRRHAAARHRLRPQQPRRALPARAAPAADRARRGGQAGVRHRRAARRHEATS